MELYVYGIVREQASAPDVRGMDDADVRIVRTDGLGALVSEVAQDIDRPSRANLQAHESVLEAALADTTVLPFKFGHIVPDDETVVQEVLTPNADQLRQLLHTLEGRVELAVTATYDEDTMVHEIVENTPEIQQLRATLDQASNETEEHTARVRLGEAIAQQMQAQRERDAAALLTRLQPIADEVAPDTRDDAVLRASFLVPRDGIDPFDEAMQELSSEHGERISFSYVGPLPPYSFVALQPVM